MEISIRRIGTEKLRGDRDASDVTNIYKVIDNGREFTITYRSHRHGGTLGLAGQQGFLYTDADTERVRRQVISVGQICGISIESDDAVEGLSPWALRGVIMAERSRETREITITAGTGGAPSHQPVILVDGEITDLQKYLWPRL
jgi:hypothetical protein